MKPNVSLWCRRLRDFFRRSSKEAPEPDLLTLFLFIFWVLFSCFFLVMFFFEFRFEFGEVGAIFSKLFGISDTEQHSAKFELLKFLGVAMGGTLVALQAFASYKRSKAMEDTANTQVEANRHTQQGQRQERLKNAIDHLGSESESIRLGGSYELFHLAQDTPEFRQVVLNILCAHVRMQTNRSPYQNTYSTQPSGEIQSLLNLLFREGHEVFGGLRIDLRKSWLNGADLREAFLMKAILAGGHLRGAVLAMARLQGAVLKHTQLQGANLWIAQLQGADLSGVGLQAANLSWANLQGANLWRAEFQGADLSRTELQGAAGGAVGLSMTLAELPFARRMREGVGQETDLSEVTFEGGLTRPDVNDFVNGLSDKGSKELQRKLKPHIGRPATHQMPEDSGAVCEVYTEKEAENWITEYETAMRVRGFATRCGIDPRSGTTARRD